MDPWSSRKITKITSKHAVLSKSNIQDWVIQYDGLEEKYRKTMLENEEYKRDIHNLQCELEKLQQDLQEMDTEQQLLPIFENRLSSIQVELKNTDKEMEVYHNKMKAYEASIKALQRQNDKLQQANETLETAMKEKPIERNRPNNDHKKIKRLQRENEELQQELDLMNAAMNMQCNAIKCQSMAEEYEVHCSSPLISPGNTIRMNTAFSDFSPRGLLDCGTVNMEQVHNNFFSTSRRTKSGSTEDTEELLLKCERLEAQNEELEKKLNAFKSAQQQRYKFIDETSSEKKMGDLVKKCDFEHIEDENGALIEKYRLFMFEIQLRRAKRNK